jgi:glycosyltransferase involved in cell wall biosynthesis
MRVAFVQQPWDFARPNAFEGSLPLWIHEVTQRIGDEAEVTIYGKINPDRPREEHEGGISYRGISQRLDRPLLKILRRLPRRNELRPAFSSWMHHYAYAWGIARDLRKRDVDIVQIYNFTNFVPVIRRLNPRVKIVMHMQCEWINQLDRAMIRRRLRGVDGIIGCSEFIARRAREAHPDWPGLCECVPNGAHAQRFAPPAGGVVRGADDPIRILFVGRVSPEKGLHDLLDAFAKLRARVPNCELGILGPFGVAPYEYIAQIADADQRAVLQPLYAIDYSEQLRRRVESFNGAVKLLPKRPNTELPAVFHEADILANPSISEAFGMTIVEAMASGTPVVATRVGGMTEIVGDESAGLLVPPNDVDALAAALERLATDTALRERVGRAGPSVAAQYSWDRVADRLLSFYGGLLNTGGV